MFVDIEVFGDGSSWCARTVSGEIICRAQTVDELLAKVRSITFKDFVNREQTDPREISIRCHFVVNFSPTSPRSQVSPAGYGERESLKGSARSRTAAKRVRSSFHRRKEILAAFDRMKIQIRQGTYPNGITTFTEAARHLAHVYSVSEQTIWRWDSRFKRGGTSALADAPKKTRGISRTFGKPPKKLTPGHVELLERQIAGLSQSAQFLIRKHFLEGLSVVACERKLKAQFRGLGLNAPPNRSAIDRFLKSCNRACRFRAEAAGFLNATSD